MTRNKPIVIDGDKLKNLQPEDLSGLMTPLPRFQGTPDQMLDQYAQALCVPVPDEVRKLVGDFAARPVKKDPPRKK